MLLILNSIMSCDYSEGKIYKIISDQSELPYIGSTTKTLDERFKKHKYKYKSWKNHNTNYTCAFEIVKYDDARIELIQVYPCNSSYELEKQEGTYIQIGINCVNKQKPGQNGDYTEYHKAWYQKNKERQAELQNSASRKAYRNTKLLCECGKYIRREHLSAHRETAQHKLFVTNPEEYKQLIDRLKQEKEDNPKYKCECGAEVTNKSCVIKKHKLTKKHINLMTTNHKI